MPLSFKTPTLLKSSGDASILSCLALSAATLVASSGPGTATEFFTDGISVSKAGGFAALFVSDFSSLADDTCIGDSCTANELFTSDYSLKIRAAAPGIRFNDTSGSSPNRDWELRINDTASGGLDRFIIRDTTAVRNPFTIEGNAPEDAFWLATSGNIGLGTSMPGRELHVVGSLNPSLRLEQNTSGGFDSHTWDIGVSDSGLAFTDVGIPFSITPMVIENGAAPSSLYVKPGGLVGLGTNNPEGKLHTKGNGVQLAYFESGDGGPVQVRFRTDSQNRRFLAVNNANEVKSQIIFKDNEIQFTGATDSGANRWLTIGPAGIVSQGPTCNPGPCDRTFDRDFFTVPPIEDRAAQMWENRHLPGVGPTEPLAPINLTEKMGGVIHELEVAHIYIEELHNRLEEQETLNRQLRARQAELEAKTGMIEDLIARLETLERAN